MTKPTKHLSERRLRTPRAAAIAGIIFAVLTILSYSLMQLAIPPLHLDQGIWLESRISDISLALSLQPFAGIAFLWFMAVVRDRIGYLEDQFFSTLFFGSGLLYLAMSFAASAIAGGLLASYLLAPDLLRETGVYALSRAMIYKMNNDYAIRMAGMHMFVLGTIWIQTGVMPRWLTIITYICSLTLLIGITFIPLAMTVFPGWVFLISIYILILNYRHKKNVDTGDGLTVAE